MAAYYALQEKTLLDVLNDLYAEYGWYQEKTLNLVMPGLDGLKRMKNIMSTLREKQPTAVAGVPVAKVRDYLSGELSIEMVNNTAFDLTTLCGDKVKLHLE